MPRSVVIAPLVGVRELPEWRRVERAILSVEATRVRCLTLPPTQEEQRHVRQFVLDNLANFKDRVPYFGFDERHVNLENFDDSLAAFAQLAVEEEGNDITVLLGAGGVTGAASAVAVTLLGLRGIFPPPTNEEPAAFFPSWLRAGKVVQDHEVRLLAELLNGPLDKRGLIERLQALGIIREGIGKHAYGRVNKFIAGLDQRGFVEVLQAPDHDRRRQIITITDRGRQAHRILSIGVKAPRTTLHMRAGVATTPPVGFQRESNPDD